MNKGKLKINSDNIFPIIKKWLYSDSDIFVREMVSNATDAISKIRKLEVIGEAELAEGEEMKIVVRVNPEKKTVSFEDNGIGMDAEEVERYINEIAFSGAEAFVEKYKDKTNDDMIIGHFGLGFYSAFMVADRVSIETKSYRQDATPVYWECDGSDEYFMQEGERQERGTRITLYLNDESHEYANEYRVREVLQKYCGFMPYPIYLFKEGEEIQYREVETDEKDADGKPIMAKEEVAPVAVNDTAPLWMKTPSDCTKEEYINFYQKVFHDYKEPLFWIHLNMDYPFNLKGILYFPRLNNRYESAEGRIKLYNNQVFIADNIKEVIPEFLLLLRGTIDCPDLPLNVSRSALQNDGFVKKVSDYITKKVADKLTGMCKVEREAYESYWDDIAPFIKYGCLRDDKFEQKVMPAILFKDINDKYQTIDELHKEDTSCSEEERKDDSAEENVAEKAEETATQDKEKQTVYYVTDLKEQDSYVRMFREEGLNAVILPDEIDTAFISLLEAKHENLQFKRIDSGLNDALKGEADAVNEEVLEKIRNIYKEVLEDQAPTVQVEHLKNAGLTSVLTVSEEGRRMAEMMKMYGMGEMPGMGGADHTLILNANNAFIQKFLELQGEDAETDKLVAMYLYDLARLQNGPMDPQAMASFIERSNAILTKLI